MKKGSVAVYMEEKYVKKLQVRSKVIDVFLLNLVIEKCSKYYKTGNALGCDDCLGRV